MPKRRPSFARLARRASLNSEKSPPREVAPSRPIRTSSTSPTAVRMTFAAHIAQKGAIGERFPGDQTDVVDREHDQAHPDDEPDAAARKAQGDRRADQDEHDARGRKGELLLDLDVVTVHRRSVLDHAASSRLDSRYRVERTGHRGRCG